MRLLREDASETSASPPLHVFGAGAHDIVIRILRTLFNPVHASFVARAYARS
jgi:hypothetical protein